MHYAMSNIDFTFGCQSVKEPFVDIAIPRDPYICYKFVTENDCATKARCRWCPETRVCRHKYIQCPKTKTKSISNTAPVYDIAQQSDKEIIALLQNTGTGTNDLIRSHEETTLDTYRIAVQYNGRLMHPMKTVLRPQVFSFSDPISRMLKDIIGSAAVNFDEPVVGSRNFVRNVVPVDSSKLPWSVPDLLDTSIKVPPEFFVRINSVQSRWPSRPHLPYAHHGEMTAIMIADNVGDVGNIERLKQIAGAVQASIYKMSRGHLVIKQVLCAVISVLDPEGYENTADYRSLASLEVIKKLNWPIDDCRVRFVGTGGYSSQSTKGVILQNFPIISMGSSCSMCHLHEFLHLLGQGHSNSSTTEYGDPNCIMGGQKARNANASLSYAHAYMLGWLDNVEYFDLHKLSQPNFSETLLVRNDKNHAIVVHVPVITHITTETKPESNIHTDWLPYAIGIIYNVNGVIYYYDIVGNIDNAVIFRFTLDASTPGSSNQVSVNRARNIAYVVETSGNASTKFNAMTGPSYPMPRNIPNTMTIKVTGENNPNGAKIIISA